MTVKAPVLKRVWMQCRMIFRAARQAKHELKYSIKHTVYGGINHRCNREALIANEGWLMFITHDLGGGTRQFEDVFLMNTVNPVILRRTGYEFMRDLFFMIEAQDKKYIATLPELSLVWNKDFKEIIINSLAGYHCKYDIINKLISYKETHGNCAIRYFVHDYDCICKSKNLFANGSYCHLKCTDCGLYSESDTIPTEIHQWRKMWSQLWKITDEIRCFSYSSKELFQRIYRDVDSKRITVVPHDISYIEKASIEAGCEHPLCIGFVGNILKSEPKGKNIVAETVRRYGKKTRICIIGNKRYPVSLLIKKNVRCIGSYKRDSLNNILIENKVTHVVFPSLVPETFSYLISELISFEIPIICFNFGAQAEKVSKYNKGIVLDSETDLWRYLNELTTRF